MKLKTSNLESKDRAVDTSIIQIEEDVSHLNNVTNAIPKMETKVNISST